MSNVPRVSIGLPVYNGEKYLELTIKSILSQSFTDFELIISDNASSDRTQEICRMYAVQDERIRYFRNEQNLGAAPNHNRAFQLSSGEYFKWSGYDDLIEPEFLARCVDILDQNPSVAICMPQTAFIDEEGILIGEQEYTAIGNDLKPHHRFCDFMLRNVTGDYVYGLMRADAIRQTRLHGSYPSSDLVFIAELSFYGSFYIIPDHLFLRRYHSEQSIRGSLQVERNRVSWFDTSFQTRISLPKWQYLFGYLKAINHAHIGLYERVYCYLHLLLWALRPPHIRAMGKDVLLAIRQLIFRASVKLKVSSQ